MTQDIDLFLNLNMWLNKADALAFRAMLSRIGYKVARHSWHFKKPYPDVPDRFISLEFQARTPLKEEPVKVRNGQVGRDMGTGLAGFHTPEAFAVDESTCSLFCVDPSGKLRVPHPYAWLNLKTAAAYDWLREKNEEIEPKVYRETGVSRRLKHVYDVYVLVAMLTEQEREEAIAIASRYEDHPIASDMRKSAVMLYADPHGEAIRAAEFYAQQSLGFQLHIDHNLFWEEGLRQALGIKT